VANLTMEKLQRNDYGGYDVTYVLQTSIGRIPFDLKLNDGSIESVQQEAFSDLHKIFSEGLDAIQPLLVK